MTPREKIAAIFAKAHSTTSPHERDNAVTLGTRLAEKAGLSLDLFDVPGRVRSRAYSGPTSEFDTRNRGQSAPGDFYSFDMYGNVDQGNFYPNVTDTELRAALDKLAEMLASRKPMPNRCHVCGASRITQGFFSACPVCL